VGGGSEGDEKGAVCGYSLILRSGSISFSGPRRGKIFFPRSVCSDELIFVTEIVAQEVLQGVRQDSQHQSVLDYLLLFPKIEDAFPDYLAASNIYRSLRKRGLTIRSPVDCLIAALAIKHKVTLLHKDSDFALISQHFPLSTV
jgi:predicted nucleic acid-binding protein